MTGKQIDPNSKASRVAAFFESNPGEWLTWDDMVTKFDLGTVQKAREIVKYLNERRGLRIRAVSVVMLSDAEAQP